MEEILEQGVDSTSLGRRIDTFSVILKHSPESVQAEYWERMLWDPEPYVRSAVFDVLLELNSLERIEALRGRSGLLAAESCKYALRLNRVHSFSDFQVPEPLSIQDRFYCGLWRAEKNDTALLYATFLTMSIRS